MQPLINVGSGILSFTRGITKEILKLGMVGYDAAADTVNAIADGANALWNEARTEARPPTDAGRSGGPEQSIG
jgi:hypothetical protein